MMDALLLEDMEFEGQAVDGTSAEASTQSIRQWTAVRHHDRVEGRVQQWTSCPCLLHDVSRTIYFRIKQ